jgi:hypothetical protein
VRRRAATPQSVGTALRETPLQSQAVTDWTKLGATCLVLGHPRRRFLVTCPCGCRHTFSAVDYRTQQAEGLWDVLLVWPQYRKVQGIEMKSRSGHLRATQRALHALAAEAGLPTYVVRTTDDVLAVARVAGVVGREEGPARC